MSLDRRGFVVLAGSMLGTLPFPTRRQARTGYTLVGGLVYDGSGREAYEADVVIRGDRIAAVARDAARDGPVIDAGGLAVAPGFIDIHSHTDSELLTDARAESKVRQGVTTEITGQDGGSMGPLPADRARAMAADYRTRGIHIDLSRVDGVLDAVERYGTSVNLGTMVGHGTVRRYVMGTTDREPTGDELAQMQSLVEQALSAGACGLSSGLEYVPGVFASIDELVALARPLGAFALPYASHIRNEDDELLGAVEEAIMVGMRAGVRVHVSHLKAQGARNWWKAGPVLEILSRARTGGEPVTFDRYPYVAYSTGLDSLLPPWAREGGVDALLLRLDSDTDRNRIEPYTRGKVSLLGDWDAVQITGSRSGELGWTEGHRLGSLARERGVDPFTLLVEIIRTGRASTGMIGFGMSEENTARILAHPQAMICSDGSALAIDGPLSEGAPHPRNFGTFPRVLGHYVRDRGDLTLEAAIRKMTTMPADLVRFRDRGRIAVGAAADVVVFDPANVRDRATFDDPKRYPDGVLHVLVNGVPVLSDGERTGARPGRALRPS